MNIDSLIYISMIKVSNVDFTDIEVDSLVKPTEVTLTIFLGTREREKLFCAFPVIQNM